MKMLVCRIVTPTGSYLVCATPRSGSTLVCQALEDTGVAGRPEEYFEALAPQRSPASAGGVLQRRRRSLDPRPPRRRGVGDEPPPRSPLWSRTAYDRYLEWAFEQGTTPNGVFGAKLMWGYLGDFVSLLRNVPELPRPALWPICCRRSSRTSPSSAWCAPTRCARPSPSGRRSRPRPGARTRRAPTPRSLEDDGRRRPTRASSTSTCPQLRFHYHAIAHLLDQILVDEARWDAFFEHVRIKPVLVLYENFAADYETSTLQPARPARPARRPRASRSSRG